MQEKIYNSLYFVLPSIILVLLSWGNFSEYPQYIHAWANYDYLALAHGFIDNGFDFFHPQTYVLNQHFPNNFTVPSQSSITSVDFPINAYVVSLLMYLFDTKSTSIYYSYQLLQIIVGIGFAGILFKRISKNHLIAWLGILFMFSSTVFLYYTHSLLPGVTAISNTFIGLYFFHCYYYSNEKNKLWWSILFLTLAGLTRTPFAIPIIALLSVIILNAFTQKKINKKLVIGVTASLTIIACYFIYNNYLRTTYGSMFLGSIKPINSLESFNNIWQKISKRWLYEYYSYYAWIVLSITFFTFLIIQTICLFTKKIVISNTFIFLSIYLIGVIIYSFLMGTQFYDHDYYFLDTFFVITTLFFVYLISTILKLANKKLIIGVCVLLGAVLFYEKSIIKENLKVRRTTYSWDVYQTSAANFIKNKTWFESLNLPKKSRILVLNAYMPNALFSIIEQHGYVLLTTNNDNIKRALTWDYDYIIIQDIYFEKDIYQNYPGILTKLKILSSGDGLSIYTYNEINPDKASNKILSGKKIINQLVIDSTFQINADNLFSNNQSIEFIAAGKITLKCTAHYDLNYSNEQMLWVIELEDSLNNRIYYRALSLNNGERMISEDININIPEELWQQPLTVKTYFWNRNKVDRAFIKDFAILITE